MNVRKALAIITTLFLVVGLTGCGANKTQTQQPASNTATETETKTDTKTETAAETKTEAENTDATEVAVSSQPTFRSPWAEQNNIPDAMYKYPMEGNPSVTWFFPMDAFISIGCKDFNTHEVFQEVQKRTGINIKFQSPPVGEFDQTFNLMVAANEYTDIITWSNVYKGGVTAGIEDGVYYDHKDIIDQYSPNYKYYRESDELRRKTTMNDQGQVLGYYNLSPYSEWMWLGLLIKKDALDKTGLPVPETIEDWDVFFEALKNAGYKGAYTTGNKSMLEWMGSFNAGYGAFEWLFVDENGKAAFGPIQPGVKDWLAKYREWFEKGYIDKEFASRDWSNMMAYAQTDDCAVITDSPDTMWGIWKTDISKDFVGANNAVLNKGDKPKTVYLHPKNGGWETSITTQAKNVEAAARLLDYGYTFDGYELYNFGLQGKTHEVDDQGKPFYQKDSAMWNENDDVPLSNRVWKYKIHQGPFIREEHNSNPMIVMEGSYSGAIRKQWTDATDAKYNFPPVTLLPTQTTREAELGSVYSARRNEVFTKIVYGELPLSAFDDYVTEVKNNGFDEWLGMWQAALDRFNAR